MWSQVARFFAPPAFRHEPFKTHVAYLLNILILAACGANLVGYVAGSFLQSFTKAGILYLGLSSCGFVVIWVVMRSGKVRLAGTLFVLLIWAQPSLAILRSGGLSSPLLSTLLVFVYLAGLLLGLPGLLAGVALSMVTCVGILELEWYGLVPPRLASIGPELNLVVFITCMGLVVVVTSLSHRSQGRAFSLVRREIAERRRAEELVLNIAQGVSSATGDFFFRTLAEQLGKALGADMTFVGEILGGTSGRIRTLAAYSDGQLVENFEYDLCGSPCELLARQKLQSYASGVRKQFPLDGMLTELNIEGFVGSLLSGSSGEAFGVMAMLFRRPLENVPLAESILQIFAARAATELDRKRAEQELHRSEERFRSLVQDSYDIITIHDSTGAVQYASGSGERILGYKQGSMRGRNVFHLIHTDDLSEVLRAFRGVLEGGSQGGWVEYRIRHASGAWIYLESILSNQLQNPAICGIVATSRDITERRRAEQALHESEERFRRLSEASFAGIAITDSGRIIDCNSRLAEMLGYEPQALVGMQIANFVELESPEVMLEHILAGGEEPHECRVRRRDGSTFPAESYAKALPLKGRTIRVAAFRDITERKRWEETLLREKQFSDSAIESVPGAFFLVDQNGKILRWNRNLMEVAGYSTAEIERMRLPDFFEGAERLRMEDGLREAFHAAESTVEARLVCSSGRRIDHLFTGRRIQLDEAPCLVVVGIDITERKRAEEEKSRLEDRLRQAHKMETIGQLAGGVAHDFNNLLSPILGYSELLLAETGPDDPCQQRLSVIRGAAERAASLTRQLLSFSRKQMLDMKTLDLNRILQDFDRILRTTIREDVDLTIILGPDLGHFSGDVSQVEQIILNLASNAQDALPSGGSVVIETYNADADEAFCARYPFVIPGHYVVLSITDNGHGMDAETLQHIFEPFYTTKAMGKGTGLGLATVYGVVKQHRGYIFVSSAPGSGSEFKVFWPQIEEPVEVKPASTGARQVKRGSETIVVVEDNELVRDLASSILTRNGYDVIVLPGAEECLQLLEERKPPIDLLLTDVVMPKINGKELYQRLNARYPGLKVLFMSGYAGNVISYHGVLDEGFNFIQKPFSVEALAGKVREVLER